MCNYTNYWQSDVSMSEQRTNKKLAPATKKAKVLQIRLDPELHRQALAYAAERGVSLGAILRAFLRGLTNPAKPGNLPPGVEDEKRRPPRRPSG